MILPETITLKISALISNIRKLSKICQQIRTFSMIFCGWNLHLIGFVSQLGRLAVELRLVSQSFKKRKKKPFSAMWLGLLVMHRLYRDICRKITQPRAEKQLLKTLQNRDTSPNSGSLCPSNLLCSNLPAITRGATGGHVGAISAPIFYHRLLSPAWPWCLPCALHAKLSLCIPLDNREPHLCYICSSQPWAMTPLYSWSALVYICVSLPPFFSFPFTQTERCVWVWPGRADVSLPPPRDTSTAFIFLGWNVRTNTQVGLMVSRFVARRLLKRRSGATAGALTDRIQHATQTCLFQHMSNQIRDDEFILFNTGGRRASGENTR